MDRNAQLSTLLFVQCASLSARRAWIEILQRDIIDTASASLSARRAWIEIKPHGPHNADCKGSLSARRAWIEMSGVIVGIPCCWQSLSARRAWIEIAGTFAIWRIHESRSPQGERG